MRYKDSLQLPFFWAINIILPITAAVYYYNFRLCKLQEKRDVGWRWQFTVLIRNKVFKILKQGENKSEILKETGSTVAIDNTSLSVREGKIFVITGLPESSKSSERT